MTPTTVSVRLAIKKIAEITCGVRPKAVPVAIAVDSTDPVFVVSIPFEYKVEVYSYLAEHLGLRSRAELLEAIAAATLHVVDRTDVRPIHPKASDATDPLHAARAAEVTSLWRLAVR